MPGCSSTRQFPSWKSGGHGRTKSNVLRTSSSHIATTWPSSPRPALIKLLLMWRGGLPSLSCLQRELWPLLFLPAMLLFISVPSFFFSLGIMTHKVHIIPSQKVLSYLFDFSWSATHYEFLQTRRRPSSKLMMLLLPSGQIPYMHFQGQQSNSKHT